MADHSFFIYKGQHKTLRFTATDAVTGNPLDLTDAGIRLTIRRRLNGELLLQKDSANPSEAAVIAPTTGGVGEVYFVPTDTIPVDPEQTVDAACYAYDCFAYDLGTGDKRAMLIEPARFEIRDAVTEWPP